jgi:hypothetical protein
VALQKLAEAKPLEARKQGAGEVPAFRSGGFGLSGHGRRLVCVRLLRLLPVGRGLDRKEEDARKPLAEVQRPLALVVLGGLGTSTLLTLVVLPGLAARWLPGRGEA